MSSWAPHWWSAHPGWHASGIRSHTLSYHPVFTSTHVEARWAYANCLIRWNSWVSFMQVHHLYFTLTESTSYFFFFIYLHAKLYKSIHHWKEVSETKHTPEFIPISLLELTGKTGVQVWGERPSNHWWVICVWALGFNCPTKRWKDHSILAFLQLIE